MAGYGPKDSPRPVCPTVSRTYTDQTRENYRCELISLSQARVEIELTSDSVEPSSRSSESIIIWVRWFVTRPRARLSQIFYTHVHSIVERRVTSFKSRAKEWRESATLHLSGTVIYVYGFIVMMIFIGCMNKVYLRVAMGLWSHASTALITACGC